MLSQLLWKHFQRALIFPLWSCSSLANQIERLKDEFLVKIIIKDKIFRDCLSAVAVAVKWPFLHRRRSVWMRQELKGNLVCKLLLVQREGLMETQGTGVLAELLWTPSHWQGALGKPGFVLTWCLEIQRFSALAVGAGAGSATSRCKIFDAD